MKIFQPIISGSLTVSGSTTITGQLIVNSGITGSLQGTASYSNNALSASFASNSNSASYASTASYVVNALTASYVVTAQTASYVLQSVSASFASTASFYGGSVVSSSYASSSTSASYAATASYVVNALTASYVVTAQTASYVLNAVSASYSTRALSSSYAATSSIATSSSYALTASYVVNALTASYVQTAQTASYVLNAVSASFTSTASLAPNYTTLTSFNSFTGSYRSGSFTGSFTGSLLGTASYATNALSSSYAGTASVLLGSVVSSSYAATSSIATSSSYALTASFALNGGGGAAFPFTGSAGISGSLTIIGSGSLLFLVTGSQGELFSISDIDSGTELFSVSSGSVDILTIDNTKTVSISGSLVVTGSITGSLFGTASYANNALSSSYAGTASVLLGSVVSASYAATASIATSSSYALTASFALNGGGGAAFPYTGSAIISGSLIVTGSIETSDTLIVNPAAPGFTGPGALIGDFRIGYSAPDTIDSFSGGAVNIGASAVILAPNGQTRIGLNDFDGTDSAVCTIYSLSKGLLIPRNDSTGKLAISAPARGLMIYETSSITEGIWYYNSGSNYQGWTRVLNNSGSQSITGSVIATSFTGSLLGTASFSSNTFTNLKTARFEMGVSSTTAITTGAKGRKTVGYNGTIVGWKLVTDQSTTMTLDVWKANNAIPTVANSITGSAAISLTAAQLGNSTTLTGWTTSVASGDVFIVNVNSNNNATYFSLELDIVLTNA